jgi:hypothetical protein
MILSRTAPSAMAGLLALSLATASMAATAPAKTASPPKAWDAKCLWEATAKTDRAAFFKAYPQKGPPAARLVMGKDAQAAEAIPRACNVPPTSEAMAGQALFAYANTIASAIVLKTEFKVDPATLRKTVLAIPSADRGRLAALARVPSKAPADGAFVRGVLVGAADKLKLTDAVARQQLAIYVASAVTVEWAQGRL